MLQLNIIMLISGEKPYKCHQCGRTFVSNGVLKAHIRIHTGVKHYKCMLCETLFTTNGSLKRHMSTHSEVRPFMCPYCQKTFKTSVNCKKHMKTHRYWFITDFFLCPYCILRKRPTKWSHRHVAKQRLIYIISQCPVKNQDYVEL